MSGCVSDCFGSSAATPSPSCTPQCCTPSKSRSAAQSFYRRWSEVPTPAQTWVTSELAPAYSHSGPSWWWTCSCNNSWPPPAPSLSWSAIFHHSLGQLLSLYKIVNFSNMMWHLLSWNYWNLVNSGKVESILV
jgi:hypothetical protein